MSKETDKRWKAFAIDWQEIADMDSEDYELKPLNQQHVAILLALLQYQKWETRWVNLGLTRDELQAYIADIEYRLMLNEGGLSMTPEELKNAIAEGQYLAFNRLAAQVVSGRYTNITVGEDGTVSDPTTGGTGSDAGLPEDDPATVLDETEAARYGASIEIGNKIELLLDKIDAYYGATNGTPVTSSAVCATQINAYFPTNPDAMTTAIAVYYSWRGVNGRVLFNTSAAFVQYLYCGSNDRFTAARYFIDVSGYDIDKQQVVNGLINALSDEFFTTYSEIGKAKPSNGYLDAACVPMATQTFTGRVFGTNYALVPSPAKKKHRLLITLSGYYTDPDGDLQDAMWYRTAAGVNTRAGFVLNHAGQNYAPSDNQVVYNTAHTYQYTVDLGDFNSAWDFIINRNAGLNVASTSPTGGFSVTIKDLGASVSQ